MRSWKVLIGLVIVNIAAWTALALGVADAKPRLYDAGCADGYARVHAVLWWSDQYGHEWLRDKLGNCEVR